MAFTQTPAGASNNYVLLGTPGIDIDTIPGKHSNVTVQALGDDDQITVQSTDGVTDGLNVFMDDGDDRVFVDAIPNLNDAAYVLTNSTIRGGVGDDILFGDESGIVDARRTAYLRNSFINGNEGRDIIRTYGLISSRIDGGKGRDSVELRNVFTGGNPNIPGNPDRYDGALVQGNVGQDTIRLELGRTNVVNSLINGNADADLISNFGSDTSGNFGAISSLNANGAYASLSTIRGGAGNDTIDLQTNVSSSLFVLGDDNNDVLLTGIGNDTVVGGSGNDFISVLSGVNVIYGDTAASSVAGNDIIWVNQANNANFETSQNTVFAGEGADTVLINTDGNNVVFGDLSDTSAAGGADTITINGNGNNSVRSGIGNDIVSLDGSGSNTVFAADGNDTVSIVNGRDAYVFGEAGNDSITVSISGAASLNGAAGNDSIIVALGASSGVIDGGTGADYIQSGAGGVSSFSDSTTFVQRDVDSVAATTVANLTATGLIQNGTTFTYANGVDVITTFIQNGDLLDTDLGDLGLDANGNGRAGALYGALGVSGFDGMVFNRSYFLNGAFNGSTGVFTVGAGGPDSLIVAQGNNGPITTNASSFVIQGFDASTITSVNVA